MERTLWEMQRTLGEADMPWTRASLAVLILAHLRVQGLAIVYLLIGSWFPSWTD